MGLLGTLLALPLLPLTGPIKGTLFIAEKLAERAETELYDQDKVRAQLMELELRYDMGEIMEDQYLAAEKELLDMLKTIRKRQEEGM